MSVSPDIRQFGCGEGRGRSKDGEDLNFGLLSVDGTHDTVLFARDTVEGSERVGSFLASDFGIWVTHECVPDFDGATTFEDVDPNRTSIWIKR